MLTYGLTKGRGTYIRGNKGRRYDCLPQNPRRGSSSRLTYRRLLRTLKRQARQQAKKDIQRGIEEYDETLHP